MKPRTLVAVIGVLLLLAVLSNLFNWARWLAIGLIVVTVIYAGSKR